MSEESFTQQYANDIIKNNKFNDLSVDDLQTIYFIKFGCYYNTFKNKKEKEVRLDMIKSLKTEKKANPLYVDGEIKK